MQYEYMLHGKEPWKYAKCLKNPVKKNTYCMIPLYDVYRQFYRDSKQIQFSSIQFSHSVMSDSLWPHRLQQTRLLCPALSPAVCSNLMSVQSVMPSNHLILCRPFSCCLPSFPASGSFPMSELFASDGQSIGASASALVLPMQNSYICKWEVHEC